LNVSMLILHTLCISFSFSWEEEAQLPVTGCRLLAIGSQGLLKLLQVEPKQTSPASLLCVSEWSAERLLQAVREFGHSVAQVHSLRLLSFASGCCRVLLNWEWLLQLHWQHVEENLQTSSCCRVELHESERNLAVNHCVCTETLFILSSTGLISVHNVSDGCLLARVDLPAYLNSELTEDELSSSLPSSSSFCLFQVSADLSTVVAVTGSHTAVAVDLNHYFRKHSQHLLCAASKRHSSLRPEHMKDQDSVFSSSSSIAALGATFTTDRSWEARLASMHSLAQQGETLLHYSTSSNKAWMSWWSSLPHLESHLEPLSAQSRAPPDGMIVNLSVPEVFAPSLLSVSEFSALLTFSSPGNTNTTVVYWDFVSKTVSYHEVDGEAAPVQHCGEQQQRLLLKKSGLSQVLFSVSQQELLSRLMMFGTASTVDAVCHLNNWGRCSVPIHTLQAGLKNRQLDTVDFYLKSKENALNPETASTDSLTNGVQELCPALDLLCSAVKDSHSEANSRQFSEQLLLITMTFVNTQIRSVLSNTHCECVDILDQYATELRTYMKRFPWSPKADLITAASVQKEAQDEWELLPMEELIHQSILTNQIPRAQFILQRQGRPEQHLSALRVEGLRQVISCLRNRDLQRAKTLLINMVRASQMHYPPMVLILQQGSSLWEVLLILQNTNLCSFPRVPQMLPTMNGGEELLRELLEQESSEELEGGLWRNLRLDWVKDWDQSSQTAVLLSRRKPSDLSSCGSSELWRYLTSLHDMDRVLNWIQSIDTPGTNQWPELTPELVNDYTVCSTLMRENILDVLARRGVFIPDELSDCGQLLWRLAQTGALMASSHPIPHYHSPLSLHSILIPFCMDRILQYLLYTYLEHYRLTPRNCPLLTNQTLSESQPWVEMMVKIQEITRDVTDPVLVFQASLISAQVLLPGGQASLSSLLLEGHSLLALATIMFAPGGLDQVHKRGTGQLQSAVDPQLMKMALTAHPKLKAALFPGSPRGNGPPADISVYHLLQSLHPLDPSKLFGWQAANTLKSTETLELPHFSSSHLINSFALMENLDFLFYLRHGRPSFAYATLLVQKLSSCKDWAWQQAYCCALQCFNVPSVTSAAICFCELLGVSSFKLRVDIRVLNLILQHWSGNAHTAPTVHVQALASKGLKLVKEEPATAQELIGYLEAAVVDTLQQRGINRSSYEAAQDWALPVQFCQLHSLTLSSVYPSHCAQDKHLIHFLLFVQLHNFPPEQVKSLVAQFGPTLQAHLSIVFEDLQVYSQTSDCDLKVQSGLLRQQKASGTTQHYSDLFQVLLQSQEEASPCRYLLQEAVIQRCPMLAILAACLQRSELLPCLCVWVLTSIDDVTAREATSHLPEAPQDHQWSLHDLSIIWKTLLGRGLVRPLLRGFELFQRECPLVLVLRMFELCCDYRNFTDAKSKLLDFQRVLITLRNSEPNSDHVLPLQWVESQASVLLLTMLHRCSSQYDLHRLLQLLADVDKLLKSNGPNFRLLSQLSLLLQGSEVRLSPRLLQCTSPSVQQEEFQAAVDALQTNGHYTKARQVALLVGLPVHHLVLSQVKVNSQKSKQQWRRLEARATFWRKCHDQLKANTIDPLLASQFFLSHADTVPVSAEAPKELLEVQERCLLLKLAAHWLSLLSPAPVDQLESLEKMLWQSRVCEHTLTVTAGQENVFTVHPVADMNTHEELLKEFSFCNISELNTEKFLRLEGLPGQSEEPVKNQEETVLVSLINQLLDEGSIHEASRVCRYFSIFHSDVWLVLRCRSLASGELKPETEEETSEASAQKGLSSSQSFSSLSSFVFLPLPEDPVSVQLQKLVRQCQHGREYCKKVLSLYQLSKELQCSFIQICNQDPSLVLENLLKTEQPDSFRKAQAFIRAQSLSASTVARLVSSAIVQALQVSSQELQPEKQVFRPSEGRDSLVQLIKLCDEPNLLGVRLMENLNTVPLRDPGCIVELLIVAHDCFTLTCNMEGIVRVLQAARHLSHTYLAPRELYSQLVRLLTGIGRYNEMTYVLDLLHQNHCFEMLLRKKVETETGLKTALLDYIKRWLPADSEKHNMVALCFSMRREIGENHEMAAKTQLKMIESQPWVVTPELKSSLVKVLSLLKDAAESFSKDSCVRQASRCVCTAKLITLQLHFLNQGSELRIINLRPTEVLNALLALPRCYQVMVVSEAYSYSPDWAEILYQKVILNGDFTFLEEFKHQRPLTSTLFEDIFEKINGGSSTITPNVKRLLTHCEDVYSRYRLAYQHNFYDVTKMLLQDSKTCNYLNDKLAS
uniref:Spatacsin-like n=1 Tax=Gouania willdenowi TaxID=441366 RepID=A0A8C5HR99_GOUWI